MPTLVTALLFYFSPAVVGVSEDERQWKLLLMIFLTTYLIPLFSIFMLHKLGTIRNFTMEDRSDRFFPFFTTTLFYGLTTYLFIKQLPILHLLIIILGSITVCIALVTVISVFWKISAHSVGIAGIMAVLFAVYYKFSGVELYYPFLISILVTGSLMTARLSLNTHTPSQVFVGALLGMLVCFSAVWWLG